MGEARKPINLTKGYLEQIKLPASGEYDIYHDAKVKGLSLRVSSKGKMTFFSRGRVNGKPFNAKYGTYPNTTPDQARVEARTALNLIDRGINPNEKASDTKLKKITLNQVFEDYIISRGTNLVEDTIANYRSAYEHYLKEDWGKKELLAISRDMVEEKHRNITDGSSKRKGTPTRANTVMRIVRAIFNYAMGKYEDAKGEPIILHNPVSRLSHVKAWNRETRKQNIIKTYDLKAWWDALNALPKHKLNTKKPNSSETAKDYLKFVLLTGLRRKEASTLEWTDIDFRDNTLAIEYTKNHEWHALPLTPFLMDMLRERKANSDSLFVFEGEDPTKPINEFKKQIKKVREISGVYFTIHDLRRTFLTIVEGQDAPEYVIKRLANHKGGSRDVTLGYIIKNVERLRKPMNKLTDFVLGQVSGH
jgi:integrase